MEALNYEEEDNYSDIKPLKFYNEKEFNKELDEIMQLTKDNTSDWKKRESALKKLGGIFLSDYGSKDSFIKTFNQKIFLNISIQLLDLRSGLMKEACRIATLAAKVYGGKIETAAERLISPLVLYKLVNSANKLISDTGAICISQIIKNVESAKIITRIHEQMKNKCNTVRLRACQHLLIVLNNYNLNTINKSAAFIEEFITSTTHDANMDVRIHGRKLYFKYLEISQIAASKLFSTFENNVQKTIKEEIINNETNLQSNRGIFSHRSSEDDYLDETEDLRISDNLRKALSNQKFNSKKSSEYKSSANFDPLYENEARNLFASSLNNTNSGNLHKKTENTHSEAYDIKFSSTIPKRFSNLDMSYMDQMDVKPFSKTEKKEVLTRLNSMKIGTTHNLESQYPKNSNSSKVSPNINKKITIQKPRCNTSINLEHDFHKLKESTAQKNLAPIKRNSFNDNAMSQYFTEKPRYKYIEDIIKSKINTVLNSKKREDLKQKIEAFEEISTNFNEIYSNGEFLSKPLLKNLMSVHITNMSEGSEKLLVFVMKNLTKFIFYMDEIFTEENITKITKIVILNISSDNEEISQNATALFEIMRKKIDSNIIIKPLIEIIQEDTTNFVILEICFEFLNPLIELSMMTLSDQNYLTKLVINLGIILLRLDKEADTNLNIRDLMNKILDCHENIYKKYPKQYLNCFKSEKFEVDLKQFVVKLFNKFNKKSLEDYISKNTEFISSNYNSSFTADTAKSISISNTANCSNNFSTNTTSFNNDNTASLNLFKNTNNTFSNYYSSNQNGFNYDENLNLKNVNYDVLRVAYETKLTSFVDYLHSDPHFNTENFLLALNKIKYDQVFFILNHIYFLLDSEEHKYLLADYYSLFINRIIFLLDKFFTEYSEQIKEIIQMIPVKLDKELFLQLIPKYITGRQSPHIVQILLLSINSVINHIEQENLLLLLPSFVETLFNTLNHHISDVRKYAVYCVVDLYLILGKDFDVYLNELNPSQKNLINIYVKKKLENNNF